MSYCSDDGPGGISFALSRVFEEVKGVDLSENFILKCKAFKETDEITYQMPAEGNILREVIITYKIPEDIVSQLNRFLILFELQLRLATPSLFSPHPHPQ